VERDGEGTTDDSNGGLYAGVGVAVLLAVLTAAYGGSAMRWAVVGLCFGLLAGVRLAAWPSGGLPALPAPQWRLAGALIPLFALVLLGTSGLSPLLALPGGFLLGVLGGWLGAWRASRAAAPYSARDLVAPGVALAIVLLSAVLTPAPLASSLLLAGLALLVAGVVGVVLLAVIRQVRGAPPPANAVGAYRWFLVSAFCAVVAFVLGSHELSRVDGPLQERVEAIAERDHGAPVATAAVLERAKDLRVSMLLRTYAPRLFLPSENSAWPHHPAIDVLESEVVDRKTGETMKPAYVPGEDLEIPATCVYPKGRTCHISDGCFEAGPGCGEVQGQLDWPYGIYIPPGGDTAQNYIRPYGVMYARILHRDGDAPDEPPEAVERAFRNVREAEAHFDGRRITELLQYWMYYRYDDWRAETALGQVIQEHESDWEAVTVGISDSEPLFVAYSSHCGGQWLPWENVPAVRISDPENFIFESHARQFPEQRRAVEDLIEAARREPTHPAVMVAKGSQGNYPASSRIRVADWSSCPLGESIGDVVAAAASIREQVDAAVEVIPAEVFLAGLSTMPMRFGGNWGLNSRQRIRLPIGVDINLDGGPDTPGPPAPPQQGIWSDPFGTIFDSGDWHEGEAP
jgi:hypothetical protein